MLTGLANLTLPHYLVEISGFNNVAFVRDCGNFFGLFANAFAADVTFDETLIKAI